MKTMLVALLLVSSSAIAQVNPQLLYPQQQYNYDYYERLDDQRRLQEEFLDQQFINQQHLLNLQQWDYEKRERERCEKINPLSTSC